MNSRCKITLMGWVVAACDEAGAKDKNSYDGSKHDERKSRRHIAVGLALRLRADTGTRSAGTASAGPGPGSGRPAGAGRSLRDDPGRDLRHAAGPVAGRPPGGYTARRFGVRSINVGAVPTMVGLAVDYCAMSPQQTVASTFAHAYRDTRHW
jgi:hypothetical protein